MISSNAIPENIRRRMQPEDRRELKCPTQPEADAKFIARAEKKLQENIANILHHRGICFFRQRMDKRTTGRVGQPDFIFAIHGRACAVECKTLDGRLTAEQTNVLGQLCIDGWHTTVVRSEAEFLAWLNAIQETISEVTNG